MKTLKKIFNLNKLSTLLLYTSILTFIISFNFAHNPPGGWYQQFMPNLNGRGISDITFLDSLIGYAVTPYTSNDTAFIVKTTNGGDNWFIIRTQLTNIDGGFNRVHFINSNTGFAGGNFIFKTTNEGNNWIKINTPTVYDDMFVLNEDTIWGANHIATFGGLYRTTNGGTSWTLQFNKTGSGNPNKIYFFNKDIGFITGGSFLWKTTDSGISWNEIPGVGGFRDMFFTDSLIGYKAYNAIMQKTINGGLNWTNQTMPTGGYILTSGMLSFSHLNSDTIWGVGGTAFYGSGRFRGLIYRTTNGGTNWLYQIPDTTIPIGAYFHADFINNLTGWCYNDWSGVHTKIGGDSIFTIITSNNNSVLPKDYSLYQNYPNPFNPQTIINYELKNTNYVSLKVYDINGRELKTLINKKQNSGNYKLEFDGTGYPSGVYLYSLFIDGEIVDTKKMVLVR